MRRDQSSVERVMKPEESSIVSKLFIDKGEPRIFIVANGDGRKHDNQPNIFTSLQIFIHQLDSQIPHSCGKHSFDEPSR